jgi:hypothetical protein
MMGRSSWAVVVLNGRVLWTRMERVEDGNGRGEGWGCSWAPFIGPGLLAGQSGRGNGSGRWWFLIGLDCTRYEMENIKVLPFL